MFVSLKKTDDVMTVDLDRALELIAAKKATHPRQGRFKKAADKQAPVKKKAVVKKATVKKKPEKKTAVKKIKEK